MDSTSGHQHPAQEEKGGCNEDHPGEVQYDAHSGHLGDGEAVGAEDDGVWGRGNGHHESAGGGDSGGHHEHQGVDIYTHRHRRQYGQQQLRRGRVRRKLREEGHRQAEGGYNQEGWIVGQPREVGANPLGQPALGKSPGQGKPAAKE